MLRCIVIVLVVVVATVHARDDQEAILAAYLAGPFEALATSECMKYSMASWAYQTDVENATKVQQLNEQTLAFAKFEKEQWEEHFRGIDWSSFKNETVKRQLKTLSVLGVSALNDSALSELNQRQTNMTTVYSSARICPYHKQDCELSKEGLSLDPGIEKVMATSRDYDELEYVWKAWRDASGARMRSDYKKYVELSNVAAKINGFQDYGEMWRHDFESENLVDEMMKLWSQVEPLYVDLHTYVRRKLQQVYGDKIGEEDGLIPAHLLGNMWAQSWDNIYDIVKPFPDATLVNITSSLIEQGYNARRMFVTSDEFYQSLGLPENSMSYNESVAVIEKPTDGRVVVCHASAWDFCNKRDFRIKMCTKINMEDFVTIHHEMGHIQYYIQYKDQPYALRGGANPGFHEAVGDTIALSVSTPKHLEKIGLLTNYTGTYNDSINSLMQIALQKVAFLPFGLLIDMWRWDVFSGKIPESKWNAHWWDLREKIQRVKAPSPRVETDFDPGAKYHVPADSQYISYFVAHILQFQLHKSLCIAAEQYDPNTSTGQPLHKCDIFRSKEAGTLFSKGLSLGSSRHWSDTLEIMTGSRAMDGNALLEYFKPLHEYLQAENALYLKRESRSAMDGSGGGGGGGGGSQAIPITVGAVMLAIVVVVIIGYLVMRRRAARKSVSVGQT